MRLTILGGSGAWPTAGQGCSGYLVEYAGFRLLLDPGYATFPPLLGRVDATGVDAVLVTHGHPDHCADLNPLLRARAMSDDPPPALPVHSPPGALDAVLALDRPGMLDDAYVLREFEPGDGFAIGPFAVETRDLPHSRPNAGVRLTTADESIAYTGDTGPSPAITELARDVGAFLCEATYVEEVPEENAGTLLTARLAGRYAAEARVGSLVLTHLWPGTDPADATRAAAEAYDGPIAIAQPGLVTWPPTGRG